MRPPGQQTEPAGSNPGGPRSGVRAEGLGAGCLETCTPGSEEGKTGRPVYLFHSEGAPMDMNELLVQAEELFEANRYSEAARLFQLVSEKQLPTTAHLINWSVAQGQAQLCDLREIAIKYPTSLECHIAVVNQLIRIGMEGQAAMYCTDLMGLFRDSKSDLQIRLLRLRAELSCRKIEHVVDDFLRIWHAEIELQPLVRIRSRLLRDIAAINDEKMLP